MTIPFHCPQCNAFTQVEDRYAGQTGPCATCGKTITIPEAVPRAKGSGNKASGQVVPWAIALAGAGVLVLMVFLFGGLLVAFLVPSVIPASQGPPDTCQANLVKIAAAMLAYQEDHGTLPPAQVLDDDGAARHSWRVLLLPYLGYSDLYEEYRFEEPWDSDSNLTLIARMPPVYACPSGSGADLGETNYLVISGKGLAFHADHTSITSSFSDGAENTILVVESRDAQVSWTSPKDIDAAEISWNVDRDPNGIGSPHRGGAGIAMADGKVYRYTRLTPAEQLHALATTDGHESVKPSDSAEE